VRDERNENFKDVFKSAKTFQPPFRNSTKTEPNTRVIPPFLERAKSRG
jgi:hypothetical protein